ncbi:hypothetical protein ACQCSU_04150 [Pseudarthrobacter sp. O4]|uniref:hypothetical protein n=1 Tax=Pseudarthrobacter sp. O4 TaxID=3418417 RepID=UPI003CF1079E
MGRGLVVFLADLRAVADLREEFLLWPEVVGQRPLERPDPVEQLQFPGGVVAVVADGLADDMQFVCSTWAPSFLFPDWDRVNVRFSCSHKVSSSQLMNSEPISQLCRCGHNSDYAGRQEAPCRGGGGDGRGVDGRTHPPAGTAEVTVTSAMHNAIMAPLWGAEAALDQPQAAHAGIPARVRLGDLAPGRQVLDTEVKLITHAIRMAAYNTAMTIGREIRTNTGYKRAADEAHAIMRQAFNQPGDIDPTVPGFLTIRLGPLPTKRATQAIDELCEHLTSTETRYPADPQIRHQKQHPIAQPLNRQCVGVLRPERTPSQHAREAFSIGTIGPIFGWR